MQKTLTEQKEASEQTIASLTAELGKVQADSKAFHTKYMEVVNELEEAHRSIASLGRQITAQVC